jgi:DNA repair exonuclease SbcCD nuclease subunit
MLGQSYHGALMIYCIGDLQYYSHLQPWCKELSEKCENWLLNLDFKPGSDCILLGDIVERSSNYGEITCDVLKFFKKFAKLFNRVIIIAGNHDHKFLNNESVYFTDYLQTIPNVECVNTECILDVSGKKVICLPHKKVLGQTLEDYYNSGLGEEYYKQADLICGHIALTNTSKFFTGLHLPNFNYKWAAFGHIHSRVGDNAFHYTGSIAPLKINEVETKLPRCIKVIDGDNYSEIEVPELVVYENVEFPNMPEFKQYSDSKVHIYTIKNCDNLMKARSFYGSDYYIRAVEKKVEINSAVVTEKQKLFSNKIEALKSMLKENKIILKRNVQVYVEDILNGKN